ncbi:MAG: type II toxin-antitoxin system death-on-curing family toxin [Parvularculaceae bacterium]
MTQKLRIPTIQVVRDAHAREMAIAGQKSRIRDESVLESACARPQNRAAYDDDATIYDIAAEFAFGLARSQSFVDGNKRAAFAAAYMTLRMNGLLPDWTNREAIEVFNDLAAGKLSQGDLARWLEANTLLAPD